jgi:hypothetical protein
MLKYGSIMLGLIIALVAQVGVAQDGNIPGVKDVAPGVRTIDGSKVPTTHLSAAALKAAIERDPSFQEVRKLFNVDGIASPGPAGTTTYMYKMHDPDTKDDLVVILFVKGKKIVDFLIS